jgi:hypothetical protein
MVKIQVITNNLIFPLDFKAADDLDFVCIPPTVFKWAIKRQIKAMASSIIMPLSQPILRKTIFIAPFAFPPDPAKLLPAACDGSHFRVPCLDKNDNEACTSLDLVHDPPNLTSSVVCLPQRFCSMVLMTHPIPHHP